MGTNLGIVEILPAVPAPALPVTPTVPETPGVPELAVTEAPVRPNAKTGAAVPAVDVPEAPVVLLTVVDGVSVPVAAVAELPVIESVTSLPVVTLPAEVLSCGLVRPMANDCVTDPELLVALTPVVVTAIVGGSVPGADVPIAPAMPTVRSVLNVCERKRGPGRKRPGPTMKNGGMDVEIPTEGATVAAGLISTTAMPHWFDVCVVVIVYVVPELVVCVFCALVRKSPAASLSDEMMLVFVPAVFVLPKSSAELVITELFALQTAPAAVVPLVPFAPPVLPIELESVPVDSSTRIRAPAPAVLV